MNIDKFKDIMELVRHFLRTDPRTRGNDLLLCMRVCERMELCRRVDRTRWGSGWFFKEFNVINNVIPSGILETVRRSRQKIQELHPELKPDIKTQSQRTIKEVKMKNMMKLEV
jgi:hypothetical protein